MSRLSPLVLALTLALSTGEAQAQTVPEKMPTAQQVAQQPLAAPRGLSVTPSPGDLGQHELKLRWDPVPGATGYEVYQWLRGKWWFNEDDANRTPLTTSTTISGLDSGTAYEFCVKAVGEGGKTSGFSASAGGRTMPPGEVGPPSQVTPRLPPRSTPKGPPPEPPSGVIGLYSEQDKIRLSWRPVQGAARYSVEEEKNGQWKPAEKVVGEVSAPSVVLIDRPRPGPYRFRVRAVNRDGTLSEPSWPISVEH